MNSPVKKTGGLLGTSKKGNSANSIRITKRRDDGSKYAFAKEKVVPPGMYRSKIAGVINSETKAGDEAVDVHYDLLAANGHRYRVLMRYPVDSSHFDDLCDALFAAGIPQNASFTKAIGVEEEVELAYEDDSRFGSFVSRRPLAEAVVASAASPNNMDDDSEYDDFLTDEDDDDE